MSHDSNTNSQSLDLLRWTFTSNPERAAAIKDYLTDLGLDVLVREEGSFMVTWDEPDQEVEDIIGEMWELNGAPFEVTQEEFHCVGTHTLYHIESDNAGDEAAA